MRSFEFGGTRHRIPPFPHHKNYAYRYYRFFDAKSLLGFMTLDGFGQIFRKIYLNKRYATSIPRILLIDPTSACNLKCTGCWAADYEKNASLSFQKIDELLHDAAKMGIIQVIFTGGEPLMRKDDIIRLAEKHRKLTFGMFTNGTLIDEDYAREMARVENLNAFVSIEGFREDTDQRRGDGVYDRVIAAMNVLAKHDIAFGFSACYHARNYKTVCSDAFLDHMREKGAWMGWLFNYMPVGSDADVSLCCNPDQRAYVREKIEAYQKKHGFLVIDFANTGHKSFGCVAAANDYAHINAHGDLEPCAFCHYSDSNIHDMSLAEALRSPYFKAFRERKPFSDNFLRPCPLMDLPHILEEVNRVPGLKSTHLAHPESSEELAAKTRPLADAWEPVANRLWESVPEKEKKRFGTLTNIVLRMHHRKGLTGK